MTPLRAFSLLYPHRVVHIYRLPRSARHSCQASAKIYCFAVASILSTSTKNSNLAILTLISHLWFVRKPHSLLSLSLSLILFSAQLNANSVYIERSRERERAYRYRRDKNDDIPFASSWLFLSASDRFSALACIVLFVCSSSFSFLWIDRHFVRQNWSIVNARCVMLRIAFFNANNC